MSDPIIDRAIEIIEKGWCKGAAAVDSDGNRIFLIDIHRGERGAKYCLMGAVACAYLDLNKSKAEGDEAAKKIYNLIGKSASVARFSMTDWNDVPARTKEEVLDLLKRANSEGE